MKLALCIGINSYAGSQLQGCVNDANDWADALQARGYDARTLLEEAATGADIIAGIHELVARAGYQDTIVVTFSGHGTWLPDLDGDEPDRRDEALCPYDYWSGLIVDDDLHDVFADRHRGTRIVMISDSCHSGSVTRLAAALSPDRGRVRFLPPQVTLPPGDFARAQTLTRAAAGGSRHSALLLAGCQDLEYAYDATFDARPNGAFTFIALQALRTLPPEATYRDWHAAIRTALPSVDYPQTPMLSGTSAMKHWPVL